MRCVFWKWESKFQTVFLKNNFRRTTTILKKQMKVTF